MLAKVLLSILVVVFALPAEEIVRLPATADIGISSMVYQGEDEGLKSWGKSKRWKLKSIQEMGVIRFDASAAQGRVVTAARIFLHCAGPEKLRYIRVSTVNNDWEEGSQTQDYGPPSGACFNFADFDRKREWAWPGSDLSDVIMGTGHSLHHWTECKKLDDGWISVELTPDLIYALAVGDSDGLCVQDGGNLAYHNNFIHSVEAGEKLAPYLEIALGGRLETTPAQPEVKVEPGSEVANTTHGAVKVTMVPAKDVLCWRVSLNGKPLPRWQIAHPAAEGPTVFYIQDLEPGLVCNLQFTAVARGGQTSEPVEVSVQATPARPVAPKLAKPAMPEGDAAPLASNGKLQVWACSGLIKIDPLAEGPMYDDAAGLGKANAVWDGKRAGLFGMRGEIVSCQLVVAKPAGGALPVIKAEWTALKGPDGAEIPAARIELFRNWLAQNADKQWQPAYCVPLKEGEAFGIPDAQRKLDGQKNQSLYVDILVPNNAKPGRYKGTITVAAEGASPVELPLELEVADLVMPDKLAFWPQLNCYRLPQGAGHIDIYRLAHKHRSVFFQRNFKPELQGKGKDITVDWSAYDKAVGPLLSGEAFKDLPRAGHPIEALPLPFIDSWPTELTPETYAYKGDWARYAEKDDKKRKQLAEQVLIPHAMIAPYIGGAFSAEYLDAFKSVQKQFIEHFKAQGWNDTEMQCLFMGKNTHRIQFNVNMWWTTDEPYHWDDWLALRYFGQLWCENRGGENAKQWVFRADISRPQWQARTLDGACDVIHFGTGAFSSSAMFRRCQTLCRESNFSLRVYGGVNKDNRSNYGSVAWILNAWLNGASAALPWQAMGNDASLDTNDASVGGYAMIAPGTRFGTGAVADFRLKSFRDAEQIVEYLLMFEKKFGLCREQVKRIVMEVMPLGTRVAEGAAADNADALRFETLQDWQLAGLRRQLAKTILGK